MHYGFLQQFSVAYDKFFFLLELFQLAYDKLSLRICCPALAATNNQDQPSWPICWNATKNQRLAVLKRAEGKPAQR